MDKRLSAYLELSPGDGRRRAEEALGRWVQNPDYPACPRCGASMRFVAQIELDGAIYFFTDPNCGVDASLYQDT